ncbi:MAG: Ig-like domain-containing protein [Verrucomicrobiales bacterium]|nr:Ig-like domain-containing protein [Verrucomicrobiales bacterium]
MQKLSVFRNLFPKSKTSRTQTPIEREYIAEQLEARILYSAVPADPGPDQAAQESVVSTPASDFEGVEDFVGFEDIAVSDAQFEVNDLVVLTSFENLTAEELATLAEVAIERWEASCLDDTQLEALRSIDYRIVDLDYGYLGQTEGYEILIDINASGEGWFVDLTPFEDEEFGYAQSQTILRATDGDAVYGMDLLSILMHEQGHVLGLDHIEETVGSGFMYESFSKGERRLPAVGEAEGAVPGSLSGAHQASILTLNASATDITTYAWADPTNWGSSTYPGELGNDDTANIAFSNANHVIDLGGGNYTISNFVLSEGAGNADGHIANGILNVSSISYLTGGRELFFDNNLSIVGPDGGDLRITNTPTSLRFLGEVSSGIGGSITVDGSRVVRFDPTKFAADVFNHSITNRDDGLTPGLTGIGSYVQFGFTDSGTSPAAIIGTYNVNSNGWLLLDRVVSGNQSLSVTNLSLNSDVLNYRSQDSTSTRIIADNLVLNHGGNAVRINIVDWGRVFVNQQISGDLNADLIFSGNGSIDIAAAVTTARSGNTIIEGGTVRVLGNLTSLGTGTIIVKAGATLDLGADQTSVYADLPTIIVEAGGAIVGDLRGYQISDFGEVGSGKLVQLSEGAIWNSRLGVDITAIGISGLERDLYRGTQGATEVIDLNAVGMELFKGVAFTGDSDNNFRGTITGQSGQDLEIEVLSHGSSSLTSVVRWDNTPGVITLNTGAGTDVNVTLRNSGIDVYTRGGEGLGSNGNWTVMNITGDTAESTQNNHVILRKAAPTDTGYHVGDGQILNISNARLNLASATGSGNAGDTIHPNGIVNIKSGGVLYLDDDFLTQGIFNIEAGGIVWINAATRLDAGTATFNFAEGATLMIDNDLDPTGKTNFLAALSAKGINIVFNDADADTLVGGIVLSDNATLTGRGSGSNDYGSDISFISDSVTDGQASVTFIAAEVTQADGDANVDLRLDLNGDVILPNVAVQIGQVGGAPVTVVDANGSMNQYQVVPGGIIDFQGTNVVLGDVTVESGRLHQGDGDGDTFTATSLTHHSGETSVFTRGTVSITNDVTVTAGIVDFDRADAPLGTNVVGGDVMIGGGSGTAEVQVGIGGTTDPLYSDKVLDGTFAGGSVVIGQGGQFQLEITTNTSGREGPFTVHETFVITGDNLSSDLNSQLEHDIQGTGVTRAVHYADIQLEEGAVLGINELDGVATMDLVLRGNATLSALGGADPVDIVDVSSNTPGSPRYLTIGEIGEAYDNSVTGTVDEDSSLVVQAGSTVNVSAATLNGGLLGAGSVIGPVVIGSTGYLAGGGVDQPGALIVVGNVSFDTGGRFLVQVDDSTDVATTVQVVGDVDFTGAVIDFLSGSVGDDDSYTILSATGSITGLVTGDVIGDYAVDVTDGVVKLVRNVAQISVSGNGIPIEQGDNTPTSEDKTNLGARLTVGPDIFQTFTITNNGTQDLTVSDINVGDATHFVISSFTAGVIGAGGSLTFDVVFLGDPVEGDYTTTVTIEHDDSFAADGGLGENPFIFDVSATQSIFASQPQTIVEVTGGKIVITDANGNGGKNDALTITQDGNDIIIRSTAGNQDIQALNGVTQNGGQEVRISNATETNGITFNLSGETFAGGDVITLGSNLTLGGDFIVNNGDIQLNSDVVLTATNVIFNGNVDSVPGENYALSFGPATGTVTLNGIVGSVNALASLDTSNASATVFGNNAAVTQFGLSLNYDAALDRGDGTYWDSTINATDLDSPTTLNVNSNRWDWTGVTTLAPTDVSATSNLAGITHAYSFTGGVTGANLTSFENEMSVVRNGNDSDWSNENFAIELVFRSPDLTGNHVLWESGTNTDGSIIQLNGDQVIFTVSDGGVLRTASLTLPADGLFHQITGFIDLGGSFVQLWLDGGTAAGGSQAISTETGGTFIDWTTANNSGLGRANDGVLVTGTSVFDGDIAVMRAYRLPGANYGDAEVQANWNALNTARVNAVAVTTTGAQIYSANTTLGASTTLSGSSVTFNGGVEDDGIGNTLSDLTVTATSGDVVFSGDVGGSAELTGLTTGASGTVHFNGGLSGDPLQVKTSGVQIHSGSVQTDGNTDFTGDDLIFQSSSTFGGDATFKADAISGIYYTSIPDFTGIISFGGAATFAGTASVTAESFSFADSLSLGAGDSRFLAINNGTFTGFVSGPDANLSVQVPNITDFASGLNVASITTYFGGYTRLGGNFTLNGSQNSAFNNQVLITGGNVVVDATPGTGGVTFGSTIDSAAGSNQSLMVNANGDIVFGGHIGDDSLASLSEDTGLGSLTTGGTGNVFLRNNGTGSNKLLDPIDVDGPNLFLNYVASLDPASIDLWEDLVGTQEDLEGSSTIDYLSSNNFGDLDLNTNGAPSAVTNSAHQGIHAAFTSAAIGRSLEDFFTVNNLNLSNVDISVEVWIRPSDFTGNHVIWETGQQASAGAGLILEGSTLHWMVRESATSGGFVSVDLADPLGLNLDVSDFIQIIGIYDRDATGATDAANDVIRLYVNGIEVGSFTGNIDDSSSGDDIGLGRENSSLGGFADNDGNPIAGFPYNADDYDNNFIGEIAIYRIWREALNTAQVQAAYDTVHNGITVTTTAGAFFGNNATAQGDIVIGSGSGLKFGINSSGAGGTLVGANQLILPQGTGLDLSNAGSLLFEPGFDFSTEPAIGQTYTLIDNQNLADGVTGSFSNALEDVTFQLAGFNWKVNYNAGDGNDVVLTFLGSNAVVDSEVLLDENGVLLIRDAADSGDTTNSLTISEVNEGGELYLVISDGIGSVGLGAGGVGNEQLASLSRPAPATVKVLKNLVTSIVIQTAFGGDETSDSSQDTVNINAELNLSGPITITADIINVNAALNSSLNTLAGAASVNFNSVTPAFGGDLIVTGGSISVNSALDAGGIVNFSAVNLVTIGGVMTTASTFMVESGGSVSFSSDVTAYGDVNITLASPDPAVGSINLGGANLISTTGNLTLTGTKVLTTNTTLTGVGVFLLDGDAGIYNPGVGQTQANGTYGVTQLNTFTLTISTSGLDAAGGNQTGRISGTGSIVKTGSGTWNLMPYHDIANLPDNNTAPNNNLRNDFATNTPVLVQQGTLLIAGGTGNQSRASVNSALITVSSGATLDLNRPNQLGDLSVVHLEAGATFLVRQGETIGAVTGTGSLILDNGSFQLRNEAIRSFSGELTGDSNLFLLGQVTAERPWILNETGIGSFTGIITIGNATGGSIGPNAQHGLYVNGITDANLIRVNSQRESNATMDVVVGTLGGSGTIQSNVISHILSNFRPGQDGLGTASVGTLTVEGSVTLGAASVDAAINSLVVGGVIIEDPALAGSPAGWIGSNATTRLEMRVDDANGISDKLVVTGDLDISNTDLKLFGLDGVTPLTTVDDAFYTLITYGGTLTGTAFASVFNLPAGYEINFDTAGEIRLTTIIPAVVSISPEDGSSGVQIDRDLIIEFNQPIVASTGNITISGGSSGPIVIPVNDPQITISGGTLTINPVDDLELSTAYSIQIESGALQDLDGNPFPGIDALDTDTWNFSTNDDLPPETLVTLEGGVLTIVDRRGDSEDNLTIQDNGLGQFVITDTKGLTVGVGVGLTDTDTAPNSVSIAKSGITSIVINTANASGDAQVDVVTISDAITVSGDITITAETIYLNAPVISTGGIVTYHGNVVMTSDLTLGGQKVIFNGRIDSDAGQNRALNFAVGTGTVTFNGIVGGTDALASLDTTNAATTLLGDNPMVTQANLTLNWDASLDRGDGIYWDSTLNATDINAGAPVSTDRSGNRWDWTGVTNQSATDVSSISNLAGITHAYEFGGAVTGAQMGSFESEVGLTLRNGNDLDWTNENLALELVFRPSATDLSGIHILWESGGSSVEDGTAIYLEDGVVKLISGDATVNRTVALTTQLTAGVFYQVVAFIDVLNNDVATLWLNGGAAAGGEEGTSLETDQTFADWSTNKNQGLGQLIDSGKVGVSGSRFDGQIAVMRAYRNVPATFGALEVQTNWNVLNTVRTTAVAVNTVGTQTYSASVTLGASTVLNASAVTFTGTVDDDGNGATLSDLTINTSGGDITFSNDVGGIVELTGITTGTGATVVFNGGSIGDSLQIKTSGIQSYGGNIVTALNGNADFVADHLYFLGSTNNFGGDATFRADAVSSSYSTATSGFTGRVSFSGATNFAGTATITAESFYFASTLDLGTGTSRFVAIGTGTFSGAITGSSADLNLKVATITEFASSIEVASMTTFFGGYTKLGGNVTLHGPASSSFNNQVLITGGNLIIDATAGTGGVTFGSTIDSATGGNQSLTVNANGDIVFAGDIGNDSLGSLSEDTGLGSLITGGSGNVFIRNYGTGYNRMLEPFDGEGGNLALNYVAALDPVIGANQLWEDLVGANEDLEGSSTASYLGSANFANLDFNTDGTPVAVTDSNHKGIHAAFTSPAIGRSLEDFFPINNVNMSNVDVTLEVWARLNPDYALDTTARVIWETGSSGASQPGMAVSVLGSVLTLAAQEDDDRLSGVGAGTRDAGGTFAVDLSTLGIDLNDFFQVVVSYDRDGGSGVGANNDIVRLYINGVLVGAIDNVDLDDISSGDDIGLGRQNAETGGYAIDGDRPTGSFNGEIAIYRVWREGLNTTQVQATYDAVHNGITITTTAGAFLANTTTTENGLILGTNSLLKFGLNSSGPGGALQGVNSLVIPEGASLNLGNIGDNLIFEVGFDFNTQPALNETFTLISNENVSGGIIGVFDNAQEDTVFVANGFEWKVNYGAGVGGNDVVLTYLGESLIVDSEVSLDANGVLTVRDAASSGDTVNSLTITEVEDGGIIYLVITDGIGSVGKAAAGSGNEQIASLQRPAPAIVRVEKSLVTSIVIQTAFNGDESTDLSEDTVNINVDLSLIGALTVTADTINVNATLSSSGTILAGTTAVNFNSVTPDVAGNLTVTGDSINVNSGLEVTGLIDFLANKSVNLGSPISSTSHVKIAVVSPDPLIGAINIGARVTATNGNIVLTGTKILSADVTLSAVSVVLDDGDPATGSTNSNPAFGVTELNGKTLTIDVSGSYVRDNATPANHRNLQTGRINGAGTLIKTGAGEWNLMAYADQFNGFGGNTADGLYNTFVTDAQILIQEGTLSVKDGEDNQSRAVRNRATIIISDGATLALNRSTALHDQTSIHIEAGGEFINNSGDLIGKITGSGTLNLQSGTLQSRNDPAEFGTYSTFNGEIIGSGGFSLRGQNNAEQPWILTETGTGSYTGTIVIGFYGGNTVGLNSQHALYVNGITDAALIQARSYQEDNGPDITVGSIGGIGTIQGNVSSQILTIFRPGQDGMGGLAMGTLTVVGNVTLGAASSDPTSITSGNTRLEMRIDDANGTSDKLVVNGNLDISNTALSFFGPDGVTAPGSVNIPTYTLISYTGTLTGTSFAAESNIPAGYEVVIDPVAKEIRLVTIAPAIVSLTPSDDSSGYQVDSNLVVEFNQDIQIGSGNITIFNHTNATSTVIPVGDAQVSISGRTLTINPTLNLELGSDYYIMIDSGAITDTDGSPNPFDGINDSTSWNFTTSVELPPETLVTVVNGVLTITDVKSDSADQIIVTDDGFGRFVISDTGGLLVGAGLGVVDLDSNPNTVTLAQSGISSLVINTVNADSDTQVDSVSIDSAISLTGLIEITAETINLNADLGSSGDAVTLNGDVVVGSDLTITGSVVTATGDLTIGSSQTNHLNIVGDAVLVGNLNFEYDGSAAGSADRLSVTGNLDLSGATLVLSSIGSAADDSVYELISYTGTLTGSLVSGAIGIPAGYRIDESTPNIIRLVESVAPTVNSFERSLPTAENTNVDSLVFRATFSEAVLNVDATDFMVSGTTASITNVNQIADGVYDITISGGDLATVNGVVGLDFAAGQNITDTVGNAFVTIEPAIDQTYTIDNAAPVPVIAAASNPSFVNPFTITVDFGEVVSGFDAGDITVGGGTVQGAVTDDGNGKFTVTVLAAADGNITIDIAAGAAQDLAGNDSGAATGLTVLVDTNNRPVALDSSVTTIEDSSATFSVADFSFTDTEGDSMVSITVSNLTLSSGDTLTVDQGAGAIAVTNGMTITAAQISSLIYTPAADQNGAGRSRFDFTVNDNGLGTVAATMLLDVTPVNDVAVFGGDLSGSGLEDGVPISGTLTVSDPIDGMGTPNYLVSVMAANGSATVDSVTGVWSYSPAANFNGADSFTIQVTDDDGHVETRTISVTVAQTDDSATFGGDISLTGSGTNLINGTLTATDAIDGMSNPDFQITTAPNLGTASIDSITGVWSYTPGSAFVGTDTFEVTVTDDDGNLAVQTITITLTDGSSPSPVVSGPTSPVTSDTFAVTVNFGEPVTGFTAGDVIVGNGSAVKVVNLGNGLYSVTIKAAGSGLVTVEIRAGSVTDLAGNLNLASARFSTIAQVGPNFDGLGSIFNQLIQEGRLFGIKGSLFLQLRADNGALIEQFNLSGGNNDFAMRIDLSESRFGEDDEMVNVTYSFSEEAHNDLLEKMAVRINRSVLKQYLNLVSDILRSLIPPVR